MDLRVVATPYRQSFSSAFLLAVWGWGFDLRILGRGVEVIVCGTHSKRSVEIDQGRRGVAVKPEGR